MRPKIEEIWNVPFYKYVSLQDARLIIENSNLKFNHPSSFNDPFDCNDLLIKFDFDYRNHKEDIKKMVYNAYDYLDRESKRKILSDYKKHPSKFRELALEQFQKMKNEITISCFSKTNEEVLLWSHYADKHKGICIGFKFFPLTTNLCAFYPVNYVEKLESISSNEVVIDVLLHWLLSKSKHWEYEKEIRGIAKNNLELIKFPKESINEIIFGCNTSKSDIEDIKNLLKEKSYPDTIILKQMIIDKETFGLKSILL